MNPKEFLRSLSTRQLVTWRDRAESLSGIYTYFDQTKNSTHNFTVESIVNELDRRDDNPVKINKKKKSK